MVDLLVGRLGVAVHLKGVAFGASVMMVDVLLGLLGVAVHLKGVAFGASVMMVGVLLGLLGVGKYDLRRVLGFRGR